VTAHTQPFDRKMAIRLADDLVLHTKAINYLQLLREHVDFGVESPVTVIRVGQLGHHLPVTSCCI
jgi:hypothetical protein